jgi:hypothetical protein
LGALSSGGIGAELMQLDVRTIDETDAPHSMTRKQAQDFLP